MMLMVLALDESPFAMLSFLAGPAVLTNASTVLALGTANRLARTADFTRAAAAAILESTDAVDPKVIIQQEEFRSGTRRTWLLVRALNRFYMAAGLFAAATCIALIGAILDYFGAHDATPVLQFVSVLTVICGVGGLVHGTAILVKETRVALGVVERHRTEIGKWMDAHAVHTPAEINPGSVG